MKRFKDITEKLNEYGGPMVSPDEYKKLGAKMRKAGAPPMSEGRMKELHGYIERGMTAQQIARKMKLDVKTIQALMPSKKESVSEGVIKIVYKQGRSDTMHADDIQDMIDDPATYRNADNIPRWVRSIPKYKNMTDRQMTNLLKKIKAGKYKVLDLKRGVLESVNESVYKFLVVNTKTGEIESAGSTLDGRNGAKETKKEIEREGKKMQILQLKKKVSDKQMEKMLGYTLKQSDIQVGKNATVVEAVSPAQQAAIAIAKKEKGEKPKNESRAYRDAMRSMRSRGNTKGMATTKKDKDTEASADDVKSANKNIIMQLRKAADSISGSEVEFANGKGKVDRGTAQAALARFNALAKPRDKEKFQNSIRSLSDIKAILKRK